MKHRVLGLAVLLCLSTLAQAQQPRVAKRITPQQKHEVIERLAAQLQSNYVFPEVATSLAASLRAKDAAGGYAAAGDIESFSKALSDDLRTLGHDLHFNVAYDPDVRPRPANAPSLPTREQVEEARREMASRSFGIDSVRRLPGNVGYMEVRGFGPAEFVGDAMTSAMKLLSGTDALILDLRRNGGGEPDSVAYLLSHFFAEGDGRHLNDIYSRTEDSTRQYWTDPSVSVRYTKPIYVLTSRRTFSGGEEAAYDLQTQKRATLVGEVTGGGANPGEGYPLAHGFAAFIPNGRSINPVTKTNWEHVGVKPDIAVPAVDAQKVAYAAALRTVIAGTKDTDEKSPLQELLAKVEAGKEDAPVYTPPLR